ncbi:MAG: hypothetical protein MMC23_009290 [Stictis urceolatum]|nr:hypothetical protein [Stictis urceolata]
MFSYESVPLYEIMWKDNYHLESIAVPYSLNALQTAYTREASAYVNGTLYTRQCYVYGSSDCPPQIQFPTAILEKYGWGDCSISGANSGFYDPPQYLTPQNGLAEKTSTPPKTTGASTITSESPAPASTASQMPPLTSFKATSTSEVPSRFSQQSRPLEPPSSARLPRSKADPSNEHTEGSQPLQSSSAGKPTEQDQETIFVSPLASSAPSASDHLLSPAPDPGSHRPPAPSITINNQVFPLDPTSQQASSSINALDSSSDSALVSSPIPSSGNAPQPLTSVNTLANAIASAFGLPAPAPVDPQQTPQTSSTAPAKFGPTSPEDSQSAAHGFPGNAVSTGDPSTPISPGSSNPKPLPVTIDGSIFSAGAPAATVAGVPISVGQTAIVVGTKTIPLLLAAVSGTEGEGTASVGAATGISAEIGPGNGGSSGGKSGLGGEATGVGTVPGSAAATAVIGIDGGGRGSRGNAAAAQSAVEADIASAVEAQATEIAPGKSGGDGNVSNPGETNNATVNESTNSGSGRGSSGGSGNKGGKSTSGGAAVGNKASATTGSNKNDEANGEESGSPAATSMGSKATESVKVANAAEHVFSRWKAVHALMGALWVGLGLYIM